MSTDRKSFDLTLKSMGDDGTFTMYGAAFNNVDRGGDVIVPGAIANVPEFLSDGWIAINHRQCDLPAGYPTAASQDQRGFLVSGKFHSTAEAQACRAIVTERFAAGKTVKASIGYTINEAAYETRGGDPVRVLKSINVYEVSFVNLPMNPQADVVDAKAGNAASLNAAGVSYARSLIKAGRVSDGAWDFTGADGDALLGDGGDDWAAFGKCFLATDPGAPDGTKGHWKYPFAKKDGGQIKVFLGALRTIASRASQQGKSAIGDAASKLLAEANDKEGKSMSDRDDGAAGYLEALKELLGLSRKGGSIPVPKSKMTALKAFAESIGEHGDQTIAHAKALGEHGKSAKAMEQACKALIKSFKDAEDDDDDQDDDDDDDDQDGQAPAKGKKDDDDETMSAGKTAGKSVHREREELARRAASLYQSMSC